MPFAIAHPVAAAGRSPLVALTEVGVTYGSGATGLEAVAGVSLELYRGEVLMLTGPSGSGKTTLLQVIGFLRKPTVGAVALEGRRITVKNERQLAELRRSRCGFVFQGYNLFGTLTAAENVMVALDLKGLSGQEARARSEVLLARVGLASKAGSYPATLSGGQKQRVAIARAVAGDPSLVLADEPTAALDSEAGQSVVRLLRRLAIEEWRAVVVVTHDHRVLDQADRIIELQDGRLRPHARNEERNQ
jgi:putative ABC transport system ATP-binding protein